MIYHAFRQYEVGDIIHLDFSAYQVTSVKVFGKIKTLTLYEYKLKEAFHVQDKK